MEVFRIGKVAYTKELVASGRPNRWNKESQYVLYLGSSRSLATLELVVHRSSISPENFYKVMVVSISDADKLYSELKMADLPANWRMRKAYPELQRIGSEWYESQSSLVLRVPSAVIPQEHNYVINTRHPDFNNHIQIIRTEDFFWDRRLLG